MDAISCAKDLQPDLVLLDMEMPKLDGLVATKLISEESPKTKILVFSSHDKQEYITQSISAGATGYLLKGASDEDIKQAIRFIDKGYTHIGAGLLSKMLPMIQESTIIDAQLNNETKEISSSNKLALKAETEITQQQNKSTGQILACLIVTLTLTTGIYAMRQWLRRPLPTLGYTEQSAAIIS